MICQFFAYACDEPLGFEVDPKTRLQASKQIARPRREPHHFEYRALLALLGYCVLQNAYAVILGGVKKGNDQLCLICM